MGGLIAIGAMTLVMTLGWESFDGLGICFISLAYAGMGLILSNRFQSKDPVIPAGICATFVVTLTPLTVYEFQQAMGWWPEESVYQHYHRYIRWHWLTMELVTLMVGALILYRYPFLMMAIAVILWYLSMDIAALLVGGHADFELRGWFHCILV